MIYPIFGAIAASSSLAITRDKDAFSNCPARIEAFFIAFSASTLSPAKTVNRFSAVLSASAKSFIWRNICCSSF
jgi:hypothetical protein